MKSRFAWAAALPAFVAALYWIVLFIATHVPVQAQLLQRGRDKIIHFAAFALLGLLVTVAIQCWRRLNWRSTAAIIVGLAIYGAIDECLQGVLTTTRKADWKDWVMDVAGATAGTIAAVVLANLYAGSSSKTA